MSKAESLFFDWAKTRAKALRPLFVAVLLAALSGVAQVVQSGKVPSTWDDWKVMLSMMATGAITGAFLGVRNWLQNNWRPDRVMVWALAVGLALSLAGCATTHSSFESAQGDRASKWMVSTWGKQDAQQKTNFVAYPNNSGMELQDGAVANQDATAMVPLIQALVGAFASAGPPRQPPGQDTTVVQRLIQLESDLARLRAGFDALKPK